MAELEYQNQTAEFWIAVGPKNYTPTGYGLLLCGSASKDRLENIPWNNDMKPVYQYPSTNKSRKGTVT